jgi:RNA polymerase sigma factor (sigma-70 family)
MRSRTAAGLARAVRTLQSSPSLCDRDLLKMFVESGDQKAFEALVGRHSAMVMGVCMRVLHSHADAEDACQAVFLVLSKKAKSARWQASIANWLYTTARKVARNAQIAAARRLQRERVAAVSEIVPPADTMTARELVETLDDILDKMPQRYREPLVLCYIEGLTRDEAAGRLGVPPATLKKQLERGRKRLSDALTDRGCALSLALLAVAATSSAEASPLRLQNSILAAVGGSPSESAALLAKGFAMNGIGMKVKLAMLGVVSVAVMISGFTSMSVIAAKPQQPGVTKAAKPTLSETPQIDSKVRSVSGTVLGPDGKPVEGVVINTLKPSILGKAVVRELAKTDRNGKFTVALDPLPAGRPDLRQLVAVKSGYGPDWVTLSEVASGDVTLRLVSDDLPVKGRVTDLEGKSIPNALVKLGPIQTSESEDLSKVWEEWRTGPQRALNRASKSLFGPAPVAGLPESIRADGSGNFEISGIGRNRIIALTFEAEGIAHSMCHVTTDPKFDPKQIAPTPGEKMAMGRIDHELHGAAFTFVGKPAQRIAGTVNDAKTGKPIPGVQIMANPRNNFDNRASTIADENGRFVLLGLAKADSFDLLAFPKPDQPYFPIHFTTRGQPGLTEIPVEVKLHRGVVLKGKVIERETGKPVAGAGIRYTPLAGNEFHDKLLNGARSNPGMAWTTDLDGRFQLVVLPGAGIVTAQGETRDRLRGTDYTEVWIAEKDKPRSDRSRVNSLGETFTAADGHIITLYGQSAYAIIDPKEADESAALEMAFATGRTVSGNIVDAEGQPAEGVIAYKLAACYDVPQKLKDGRFTAIALDPEHPRTLLFVDSAKKLSASITLKGNEKDLKLKLQPWGRISGRLLDSDGKPIAGATAGIQVKVGNEVKDSYTYAAFSAVVRSFGATTDADGKFDIDIPSGEVEYLVHFHRKNQYFATDPRKQRGLAVKPGETTDAGDIQVKSE